MRYVAISLLLRARRSEGQEQSRILYQNDVPLEFFGSVVRFHSFFEVKQPSGNVEIFAPFSSLSSATNLMSDAGGRGEGSRQLTNKSTKSFRVSRRARELPLRFRRCAQSRDRLIGLSAGSIVDPCRIPRKRRTREGTRSRREIGRAFSQFRPAPPQNYTAANATLEIRYGEYNYANSTLKLSI